MEKLELIYQNILTKISNTMNSHIEIADENAIFSKDWLELFSDFDQWIITYCSLYSDFRSCWIYPTFYPKNQIEKIEQQLPHFDFIQSCVAYGQVSNGKNNWLETYWDEFDNFQKAEIPLFFHRDYYGYPKGKEHYYEFNQLVTHPIDLHWSPNKNAYCVLNSLGEEVEKIKLINNTDVKLILMKRDIIDTLLYLGNWILIRYFEIDKRKNDFPTPNQLQYSDYESKKHHLKCEIASYKKQYIMYRGAQISSPKTDYNTIFSDNNVKKRKYGKFIVHDLKNKKIIEDYSLNPKNFVNYFTESKLPYEISPIFFKAEVLDKYKNNPDKYELKERTISCRGGWYLKTYDMNEFNQVHTYAIYLSRLPYEEQLHWQQYNENPRGPISKRAIKTDFKGEFPDTESPFETLRKRLDNLSKCKIGDNIYKIWLPKGGSWETATKQLHYMKTENSNQWQDFIIALSNTTIEGLQQKTLKTIANKYGELDKDLRQLGLIKFILEKSNNKSLIADIHGVLQDLQKKRGQGKTHGNWKVPDGSLIQDANKTLKSVIDSLNKLRSVLEDLKFEQ